MTESAKNTIENVAGLYDEHYCSIAKYLIVTLLTCGLFNLYWNYRQMQACNDLLDEQVKFLKGWFKDTLHIAPIEQIAVLRLDGDLYESTMDSLKALYPKLSKGGYLLIDDYGSIARRSSGW